MQPGQPYSSAFLVCYIWKWGFCSRASSFVKHLSARLNAHLLRARNADWLRFLVARREAAFNQGHPTFQSPESQDSKGTGGGDGVVHNSCHPLYHKLGTQWCRAAPMGNIDPKEFGNMAWGHRDLAQHSDLCLIWSFSPPSSWMLRGGCRWTMSLKSLVQDSTKLWGVKVLCSGMREMLHFEKGDQEIFSAQINFTHWHKCCSLAF